MIDIDSTTKMHSDAETWNIAALHLAGRMLSSVRRNQSNHYFVNFFSPAFASMVARLHLEPGGLEHIDHGHPLNSGPSSLSETGGDGRRRW
ncbi:hypothetical protein [Brucella intermedia]|uniref:hypothetical protein n=1 Tax=Brucella intermedia TaxID=94625 RepID=UPI00124EC926|nr:hypothetical protein [Brucella intermedia]